MKIENKDFKVEITFPELLAVIATIFHYFG